MIAFARSLNASLQIRGALLISCPASTVLVGPRTNSVPERRKEPSGPSPRAPSSASAPRTRKQIVAKVSRAAGGNVAVSDRDTSLRLAAHEDHEIGVLACLDAGAFIRDDQR